MNSKGIRAQATKHWSTLGSGKQRKIDITQNELLGSVLKWIIRKRNAVKLEGKRASGR